MDLLLSPCKSPLDHISVAVTLLRLWYSSLSRFCFVWVRSQYSPGSASASLILRFHRLCTYELTMLRSSGLRCSLNIHRTMSTVLSSRCPFHTHPMYPGPWHSTKKCSIVSSCNPHALHSLSFLNLWAKNNPPTLAFCHQLCHLELYSWSIFITFLS